ncbi:hypothetical protein F0562_013444 [Nyssa sinensis]|uniref:Uncharacterized protein n=1 Tax=Nyssa sinensis TaxID=561372 RepID=A0A5J4ZNG3_9ASTE|nr:hypothetical protein F0562_013444 [Nyssa sinensis]
MVWNCTWVSVVEGRAASRAVVVAAIAPVTAGRVGYRTEEEQWQNVWISANWVRCDEVRIGQCALLTNRASSGSFLGAGTEFRCIGVGGSTRLQISERIEEALNSHFSNGIMEPGNCEKVGITNVEVNSKVKPKLEICQVCSIFLCFGTLLWWWLH